MNPGRRRVVFVCGFHIEDGTKTGAMYAIANVANMLSSTESVEFVTFPTSAYNAILRDDVRLLSNLPMDRDVYICDAELDHETFERLKAADRKIVVICQSFRDSLHGLNPEYVARSVSFADRAQLMSPLQQASFGLNDEQCVFIPNVTSAVRKSRQTNNIGTVGNLDGPRKNADETVRIGLQSTADEIHLWSASSDRWNHERVKVHEWESDKSRIYDSFDVLVFMSREETFGMVVTEAMSAGMPCVLSSIPIFEQLFGNCPGVAFIDEGNRDQAPVVVNEMLAQKDGLRDQIMAHWHEHFSEEAVHWRWLRLLDGLK